MTLVALASAKGSPGVTTSAHVLTRFWPSHRAVVFAECDPEGGDIANRLGIAATPGLSSLAAGLRERITADAVRLHSRALPGGELALVGPATAVEASSVVAACAGALATATAGSPTLDLIVDCGRLTVGSPAEPIVRLADLVVVVVRKERRPHDTAAATSHARELVGRLSTDCPVVAVVVGRGPYAVDEIEEAVGTRVVGVIPLDRRSVERLMVAPAGRRDAWLLVRAPLPRRVAGVAATILAEITPDPGAVVPPRLLRRPAS